MDRWEYLVEYLVADRGSQEAYLQNAWRGVEGLYPPQSLIPVLNERGAAGWELVSIGPYTIGMNQDVLTHTESRTWTHAYLCAWRRRLVPASNQGFEARQLGLPADPSLRPPAVPDARPAPPAPPTLPPEPAFSAEPQPMPPAPVEPPAPFEPPETGGAARPASPFGVVMEWPANPSTEPPSRDQQTE